ncbi:MAG: peptidylprolyl isomerase [Planctomycetota bacterium]
MRILPLIAFGLASLLALGAPLAAQDEAAAAKALLTKWTGFESQLRLAERNLAELQNAYNGAVGKERQDIKGRYEALRKGTIAQAKSLRDEIAAFIEAHPRNVEVRQRRLEDRVFSRLDPCIKAQDAEALWELTQDGRYLAEGGRLWKEGYRPDRAASLLAIAVERAETYDNLKKWGDALFENTDFAGAKAAYARALTKATSDRERRELQPLMVELDRYLAKWDIEKELRAKAEKEKSNPLVRIVTDRGEMIAELFEDEAPNTVANFIELAERGFYDGLTFHRCQAFFMIQGGDPAGNGSGGPGYTIKDEFALPGSRLHYPGSLSMANTGAPNSGGSQFFVCNAVTHWLNAKHTVFGRVIEGLDVAQVPPIDPTNKAAPFGIKKVEVLRKRDHDYKAEKIGK